MIAEAIAPEPTAKAVTESHLITSCFDSLTTADLTKKAATMTTRTHVTKWAPAPTNLLFRTESDSKKLVMLVDAALTSDAAVPAPKMASRADLSNPGGFVPTWGTTSSSGGS